MGLLDSMQGMMSSATSSASRGVELARLNARTKEINQERVRLASQLGAALYEQIKEQPEIGKGFEQLCRSIAELDKEREEISQQIAQLEQESKARAEAKQAYVCPNCKSVFSTGDVFCSGCGQKVETLLSSMNATGSTTSGGSICVNCGHAVDVEDVYCMTCGAKLSAAAPNASKGEREEPSVISPDALGQSSANNAQMSIAAAEVQPARCLRCGCELQPDDRFCMSCGSRVS